ncbi:MAG: nucleotidyltransferase family protein, partial [Terriglobales bacterium]
VSVSLASSTVPSLSAEDLLLVLCVHGAKHAWQRLAWVGDVAELLHVFPNLDCRRVSEEADAAGARRLLLLGLGLENRLLGEPLPAELAQQVQQDSLIQPLIEEVCGSLAGPPPENWQLHRFWMRTLKPGERAAYVLRSALTSTPAEWSLVNLPAFLFPLYVPLRLARLVAKYAARLWRALWQRERTQTH